MSEETKFVPSQAFRCNLCGIIYWESELIKNEHIGYLCQVCTFHWKQACKTLRKKIIKSKKRKARKEEK